MTTARTPVLWVCGMPGAGKTTVAWQLHQQLPGVGFVDIDQLGMCFPESPADPGRFRIAAENLSTVVAEHAAAGARAVIVSGVDDPVHGVHHDLLPNAAVTVCRLRADRDVLRRRLIARNAAEDFIAGALRAADADTRGLDTSGLSVAEVVARVREETTGWMDLDRPGAPRTRRPAAGGPVLWVCGPTGVGKSTAGHAAFLRTLPGAFVDLDQIGFFPGGHRMRAGILAGMWSVFRAAGAQRLTVVGPVEDAASIGTYRQALPEATLTVCRLHASPAELRRRILMRGAGSGWAQPGDPLAGRSTAYLSGVAAKAAADAAAFDSDGLGDVRVDTAGRDVEQVADAILSSSRRCARPAGTGPPRPSPPASSGSSGTAPTSSSSGA